MCRPSAAARFRHDVFALQVALAEALAAVRARQPVATEQLALAEGRHHVEQVDARRTVQRDDRMHVDERLPAARDIEAAAQRGQWTNALDPRHGIRSHVRGGMLERDPRLRRALDVELQHVAVVWVHGWPPFLAASWLTSLWHVRVGSNHRPRPSEGRALPAELRT